MVTRFGVVKKCLRMPTKPVTSPATEFFPLSYVRYDHMEAIGYFYLNRVLIFFQTLLGPKMHPDQPPVQTQQYPNHQGECSKAQKIFSIFPGYISNILIPFILPVSVSNCSYFLSRRVLVSGMGSQETASAQPGSSRLPMAPAALLESNNDRTSSDVGAPSLSPSPRGEISSPPAPASSISVEKPAATLMSTSFTLAAVSPTSSSFELPSRRLENMLLQSQSNAASAPETEDDGGNGGNDSKQLRYLLLRGENEPKSQAVTATSTTAPASASPRPQEQLKVATGVGDQGARETLRNARQSVANIGCLVVRPSS